MKKVLFKSMLTFALAGLAIIEMERVTEKLTRCPDMTWSEALRPFFFFTIFVFAMLIAYFTYVCLDIYKDLQD